MATILQGSVRMQGNRARIAVQLIKSVDGTQLWSETFEREMNDILAVQQEIARAVTGGAEDHAAGRKDTGAIREEYKCRSPQRLFGRAVFSGEGY